MEPDFSGWATKYNKKCSDGLTILPGAFKHDDKIQVPLVWRHDDGSPDNILGYAELQHRDEGVWTEAFFNNSKGAQSSKELLKHGDIKSLSIHAREVVKRAKDVIHGAIKEVSLVVAGANPGATIENVYFKHGDMVETIPDEVIIYSGETISHEKEDDVADTDEDKTENKSSSSSDKTVKDVYDSFSKEQKDVVHYLIGEALEAEETDDDGDDDDDDDTTTQSDSSSDLKHGGTEMAKRNVFEHGADVKEGDVLTHNDLDPSEVSTIIHDAAQVGRMSDVIQHADYGIQNLELLFPDAKSLETMPEFVKRRTEWVAGVLSGVRSTPFTRVKSVHADLTADEARALGYIKSTQKVDEVFPIMTRSTGPKTIYKRQRLDRDDIIDVTDFDIVVWIKAEMRLMLEEELAAAILIGDGRPVDSPDKIRDPSGAADGDGIRSILNDSDFYADQLQVDADMNGEALIEHIVRSRRNLRGTGRPKFYTTEDTLNDFLFARDAEGRRFYRSEAEVATALRVSDIVVVDQFERIPDLKGIIVNLADYSLGTDKGGKTTFFDDFDIDFNQHKYLYEARLSGGLTKWKSAQVIRTSAAESGGLPGIGGSAPSGSLSESTRKAGYETGEASARERGYKGKPVEGDN